jgi:hypothetical protein
VLLESGGALPKNIQKYITDIQLANAVSIIDSFYDSIGFSVVSRAAYRKSLLDYFDLMKSGFTPDDIRYARSLDVHEFENPSGKLLAHQAHHAPCHGRYDSGSQERIGETDMAKKKREAILKNAQWEEAERPGVISGESLTIWAGVVGRTSRQSQRALVQGIHRAAETRESG